MFMKDAICGKRFSTKSNAVTPLPLSCVLSNMEQKMAGMCPYQPHEEKLNSIEFHPKFGYAIMHQTPVGGAS